MTEEVTVSSRVSELQTTSGERSFTLENSALQNIANNGRAAVQLRHCSCPARCRNGNGGGEIGSGERLHRQRPAAELEQR